MPKLASHILLEHLALELEYQEKRGATAPEDLVDGLITSLRSLRFYTLGSPVYGATSNVDFDPAYNPPPLPPRKAVGPTGARGMTDEQHAAALANAFTAGCEAGLEAARIVGLDAG